MREVVVYTLMFSAMLQILMAVYAWGRKEEPAAKPFLMVSTLGAIWAFAYAMDMMSGDLQTKLLWTKIYFTAASFGPFTFLLIVLEHLELQKRLTGKNYILLLMPSAILIALVWTIPLHNLLMRDFVVTQAGPLEILQKQNGALYFPIFLTLQCISIISYYLLIRSIPGANRIKRRQSITILIALVIPFLVNIPSILNIPLIQGFDITPHALVLTSGLFAFAIFRYRWLDILPLARTTLVETMPVGVIVLDAKNRIADINPSAVSLLQISDSAVGKSAAIILAQHDPILQSGAGTEPVNKEIKVNLPEGQFRHIEVRTIPLTNLDGQPNGRVLTMQDITERKQANERLQAQLNEIESLHEKLREQAIRDPLTGLYNRRHMASTLERETQRAARHQHILSILMVEIDDFKLFNDMFGHQAGDYTLQKVATLIQENIRADDISCRFGGDEFILLLPETSIQSAQECAERLCKRAASLALEYEGKKLGALTFSIGLSAFPTHGSTIHAVLRAADTAMYRAKQAGKNRVMVAAN